VSRVLALEGMQGCMYTDRSVILLLQAEVNVDPAWGLLVPVVLDIRYRYDCMIILYDGLTYERDGM
jgi:hypothetical protein